MSYDRIVDELSGLSKLAGALVEYDPKYVAANFYEQYYSLSEANLDRVRIDDLLMLLFIKNNLYSKDIHLTIYMLNKSDEKAVPDIVRWCLEKEDVSPAFLTTAIIMSIATKYKDLKDVNPDIRKDICDLIKKVKTLLKDKETAKFFAKIYGFIELNDYLLKQGEEQNRIKKAKKGFVEYLKSGKDDSDYKTIFAEFKELINYAYTTSEGVSTRKYKNAREKYKIALNRFIEANEQGDMSICLDAVNALDDDDLQMDMYMYINEYNMPRYLSIEKEYEEKNKNTIYGYIDLFKTYGLDFSVLDPNFQNKIMEDSIEDISKKINIISIFADKKDYFGIIASTSLDILMYINEIIKKGVLEPNFVKSNISIIINSDKFDIFKTNLEFLLDKVNMKKYSDKSFLLGDINIIRNNIVLLDKYNIPYKNCLNLSFLTEDIKPKISAFVEVGLEDEIYNRPDILNIDIDLAKRVLLTRMVDGEIITDDGLSSLVINPNAFFVPAQRVNLELQIDNTEYNNGGELYVSKVDSTNLSYIMDGVVIPKTRVTEQPIKLEDIIRPSLYSKEEIKILEKNATK